MTATQFIIKLLDVVIWPATIVILVFLLRKPLTRLIPFLRRLKYKDLELDFDRKVKNLGEKIGKKMSEQGESVITTEQFEEISYSPRSAIIEAWIHLEHTVRTALKGNGVSLTRMDYVSTSHLIDTVASSRILDAQKILGLKKLRDLRNVAAHSRHFRVLPESAVKYVELADSIAKSITT